MNKKLLDDILAILGVFIVCLGIVLLLTCVMPTKDSLDDEMPMHQSHYSTIHIHRRVCSMKECKVVDVKLKARVI